MRSVLMADNPMVKRLLRNVWLLAATVAFLIVYYGVVAWLVGPVGVIVFLGVQIIAAVLLGRVLSDAQQAHEAIADIRPDRA